MILMYKLIIGAVVSVVGVGATYFATKLTKGSPAQEVAQKVEDVVDEVVIRRQAAVAAQKAPDATKPDPQ